MAQVQVPSQAPMAAAAAANGGGQNQFVTTSLYVGDLEINVTDSQLYDLFNQLGQVISVRVCRDSNTRRSLGYGYVNYGNPHDDVQRHPQPSSTLVNQSNSVSVNHHMTSSLFVADLDLEINDSQLYDFFNQLGQVTSVRVCKHMETRRSLGYGFVKYENLEDAPFSYLAGFILRDGAMRISCMLELLTDSKTARALELLNFTPLNGKPIRIMYSHRDPSIRKSGTGNIFIKNLDKAIDHKALHDTFSAFGNILSCKVATDSSGQSKGYGFVQFDNEEAAQRAIEKLNGMLLNDKQVFVGPFLRKQERESAVDKTKFNNVFVKNLSESTTDEELKRIFGEFGAITSAVVMRDEDGKSKCFGFVNFENADDAARAVEVLNGKKFDDKEWYVGKAQKKSEREVELKVRFEQTMKEAVDKYQGVNLYIKNLDDSIGDDSLKELFSQFGTITSCKVMRDPNGISRGSGFVAFSTPEEASKAMVEMNGKMVVSKPLYVALAQRKEDRKARLQAQFAQMRPVAMAPSVAPPMPIYPPGRPGLGQQIFYGQAPPTIIPPQINLHFENCNDALACMHFQPGFGYQQQLVPGMRPGAAPMPNFYMPLVQQGQQSQRPGGRRTGAVPIQQNQQPVTLMQQQMLPRGRAYRYPPGRGLPDVSMPGMLPYDMGGIPFRDAPLSQPVPIGALASALAHASPDQQRTMLGENLYPLVEQLEPDMAAKVTGMLLEMDQTEVLHLLESPDALKAKVAEAMEVLRTVAQQQQQPNSPADQLAGMSLNDNLVN
ncbi:Polyadenylate-binding protein/Hyperplastic disc protein [Dillenia turbinata]|uniref:Polyadenylate-binding protein n=1 Tax=Dillenia turbinata TaxID=194707 RepID=A0AAN8ZQ86_9MAGN